MSLRTASIQLAYSANPLLRAHLLRVLTADVPAGEEEEPKSKGHGGPPPMWKEFLEAQYEGGKRKVPNTNSKTRKDYPQVSVSTLLKSDKGFYQKVYKEYIEWMSKHKKDDPKGGPKPKKDDGPKDKKKEEGKKPTPAEIGKQVDQWQEKVGERYSALQVTGKDLKDITSLTWEVQGAITKLQSAIKANKGVDEAHEAFEKVQEKADKALDEAEKKEAPKKPVTKEDFFQATSKFYAVQKASGFPKHTFYSAEGKKVLKEYSDITAEISDDKNSGEDYAGVIAKLEKMAPAFSKAVEEAEANAKKHKEEPEKSKEEPKPKEPEKSKEKPTKLPDSAWHDYGEKQNPIRETWTYDDKAGIQSYTSEDYSSINDALRAGTSQSSYNSRTVKRLDALFADKSKSRVTHPVVVTRGVSDNHPMVKAMLAGNLAVGSMYQDPGYMSTSIKPYNSFGEYKIEIAVHKGAKGVYVGPPPSDYSEFPDERELLLNRGTKIKVTGVDKANGIITAEIVDED